MYKTSGLGFVSTDDTHSVATVLAEISNAIFDAYNNGRFLVSFSVYKDPTTGAYNYYVVTEERTDANK